MRPSRFTMLLLLNAIAVAGVIAAVNVVVDPYLVFDGPRRAGFNADKPAAATHERMMKAYDAPRRPARTVILGSSRTDIGLDPQDPAWPAALRPVYNLSLVGSGLSSSLLYLRHVVASRPAAQQPSTIIVGLDFESFLYKPTAVAAPLSRQAEPNEVEQRMLVLDNGQPNPARTLRWWKDMGAASLSLDAIADSVATIAANRRRGGANMAANGHFSEDGFKTTTAADGVAALFAQKNAEARSKFGPSRQVLSDTPQGPMPEMQTLIALVAFAKAHHMQIILAIQPSHASRLDLFTELGYWPDYERWKRALTDTVAQQRQSGAALTLWDFGGYEDYAREDIPATADRASRLKWFWDPVHYTTALGEIIIARVTGQSADRAYGVVLTPENVDAHLAEVREQRGKAPTLAVHQ